VSFSRDLDWIGACDNASQTFTSYDKSSCHKLTMFITNHVPILKLDRSTNMHRQVRQMNMYNMREPKMNDLKQKELSILLQAQTRNKDLCTVWF
jgi:hypothetical protein